ncbi:hypothetical protein [Lentilactobacillus sp. Marseille-Q4993]|uniref:hypothetical protein n=1 Tax=Lentilactobacillus sp. Marseille-Q4993 TaxID=3039492 RepID=UPI0024BD5B7A|nr:hypothetical protein [Lentilactobacillus sp. Marseille-Q4993]
MAENDYAKLLDELREGKIKEIQVNPDQFMDFQQAFMNFDYKTRVSGKAQKGGIVTYTYENEEEM